MGCVLYTINLLYFSDDPECISKLEAEKHESLFTGIVYKFNYNACKWAMLLRHYASHKVTKIDGWWCWWTLPLEHAFEEIRTNYRSIIVQKIHENLLERWHCAYANRHNVW